MLLALQLTVSFLAVLASPGQARSLEVKYRPQGAGLRGYQDSDYTYGDLDYQYEARRDREARVKGEDRPGPTHQGQDSPSYSLDDPYNYSYSYGDPNYDYDAPGDRPTGPGTDDPQPDEEETHEVDDQDDMAPPEGENDLEDDKDIEDDLANSPALPEGENEIEDDKGIEDDLPNSPTPPEGENDIEDEDDSTTSSAFRWFENQWYEVKRKTERMVSELRRVKESVVDFLYRLSDVLEKGAEYCIQKLRATAQDIDSRGTQALEKLEDHLRRGNEHVMQLFRLLGIKVQEWLEQQQQGTAHLALAGVVPGTVYRDDDRVVVNNDTVPGFSIQRHDVQMMPNFFQDEAVSEQLSQLVKEDILTEEEAKVILEMP